MNILIVYGTRHGTTEKCAGNLRDLLETDVDIIKLEKNGSYDLKPYDMVIIGSPVYAGRLLKEVRSFLTSYREALLQKSLGLYLCCITPLHEAEKYLQSLFPPEMTARAQVQGIFGGVFDFQKMSFFEKLAIRYIKKVKGNMSTLSEEHIRLFSRAVLETRDTTLP
ncbi:MAG: flavodoxin domain-containing protein [Spirochaetales bacterium]|nr:flavodoxin domain-containing protein [Spirochaetales bacterium]